MAEHIISNSEYSTKIARQEQFNYLCSLYRVDKQRLLNYAKSHNFDITDETTDSSLIGRCTWLLKSESGECY